jgi:hypothetical protein
VDEDAVTAPAGATPKVLFVGGVHRSGSISPGRVICPFRKLRVATQCSESTS